MKKRFFLYLVATLVLSACQRSEHPIEKDNRIDWKTKFNERLPLLGHRNWILIVDKAYPEQTSNGIETINTNENLLAVLRYVNVTLSKSPHVNAEVFTDKELSYLTAGQIPEIEGYRDSLKAILGIGQRQSILHDSVFVKIDAATKLFKVLVLKTNETIPYSSVFIRLNCKYWDADKEKQLRKNMENKH